MANEFIARKGYIALDNSQITGSLSVTGTVTGSIFTGSFVGDGSQLTGVTGATTASYVEYSNVANKPTLVSGSSQITYSGLTGIPSGIVSGSSQITYSGLTGIPSGIVSGSAQVAGFGIFATTGSNQFNGNQAITGSLTVTGQVVAQTLNVQQVTSSIIYSSGSNIFGNSISNTQQFTGSVGVTGSLTINGTSAVVGSGSANYVPKFTAGSILGNSLFFDNGTNLGIGTNNPTAGRLQINVSDTTTAAHFQIVDGTTTLANSFVTNFRNANDGNGRYSLSSWQVQNAVGNDQNGFIGVQSVTGGGNYTPNIVFGQKTGVSSYTTRMILDSSGNLGLGVTPSEWGSQSKTYQANAQAVFAGSTFSSGNNQTLVGNNLYVPEDTSFRYIASNPAGLYRISNDSSMQWFQSPSGTANCAISFTQAMTLNASGNLSIGNTNDTYKLDVCGTFNVRTSTGSEVRIINYGGSSAKIRGTQATLGIEACGALTLETNGANERLRIESSGIACFACELTAKSLGTNDLILNNLNHDYANYVDGTRGSWLIQEGACDLFIINQVSCKKYKFNLIEIK